MTDWLATRAQKKLNRDLTKAALVLSNYSGDSTIAEIPNKENNSISNMVSAGREFDSVNNAVKNGKINLERGARMITTAQNKMSRTKRCLMKLDEYAESVESEEGANS